MSENIIDVDDAIRVIEARRQIDRIPFDKAIFVRNGQVVELTPEDRYEWGYCGLTNTDFVELVLSEHKGLEAFRQFAKDVADAN